MSFPTYDDDTKMVRVPHSQPADEETKESHPRGHRHAEADELHERWLRNYYENKNNNMFANATYDADNEGAHDDADVDDSKNDFSDEINEVD